MQKSNYAPLASTIFILFVFLGLGNAQVVDVFQNQEHEISTFVLKAVVDKDYTPAEIEILQDKNKDPKANWKNIEDQLYALALVQIENEVAFFQLHTRALNYHKQIEKQQRIRDEYYEESQVNPIFESIEIQLVSVLNNHGTYIIQYNFEKIQVRTYYLVNYLRNKVMPFKNGPSLMQQDVLKELTNSKFATLYLLQTKKLDTKQVDRIRATQSGEEKSPNFSTQISYNEAVVYPYFNGLIVEFSAFSQSSAILDNEAFRVLIKGQELQHLLAFYPEFRPVFELPLQDPTVEGYEALNNDDNFNITRFRSAPMELDLMQNMRINPDAKKLFSFSKHNFQHHGDTIKRFMGTTKYYFDQDGNIIRIESRDDKNQVVREEVRAYNESNQLITTQISDSDAELILATYENGHLNCIETIEISDDQSYGEETRELEIYQSHYALNRNYRYVINFNVIGTLDAQRSVQMRHIDGLKNCVNSLCVLKDDSGNVVAIRSESNPIDLLMNANNQPIESHFDHDRDQYFFNYDERNRLVTFKAFSSGSRVILMEYIYTNDSKKPVIIKETRASHVISHELELEFKTD